MSGRIGKFEVMRRNCANKPCGMRAKYEAGCKCLRCRAAKSRYNSERERLRREGDTRDIVAAEAARRHLLELAEKGVGYKQVAAGAGVATSIVFQIRRGTRKRIRQSTERAILGIDESVRGGASLISAKSTWQKFNKLIGRGFTQKQLAVWLGSKAKIPSLQVNRRQIMARTAMKVDRLCALLQAGKLRRA
jgi:hypothetical protein